MTQSLKDLQIEGDIFIDKTKRILYATDASAYRQMPQGVVVPKTIEDIQKVIRFAADHQTSVIPRAAGTSLAGQVVGKGIVVDISKHFNKIIELNTEEHWIDVEPGVNLKELNDYLKPHGLIFGPETSTANRCCVGGMLGNNSCGLHSIIYGSVRDHIVSVDTILADGSLVKFEALEKSEYQEKLSLQTLEGDIYRQINSTLTNESLVKEMIEAYPHPSVTRRNMGYAIDMLSGMAPFKEGGDSFNFSKLLAGSEGTLAFTTKMRLNLLPLHQGATAIVAAHFNTIEEATRANNIALKYHPASVEMMDDIIIKCTEESPSQKENRFFLKGTPKAILVMEFYRNTVDEIKEVTDQLVGELKSSGYGFYFPLITDPKEIWRVWELRRAGLGLLSNVPGDKRSVTVIEDTAVAPEFLPEYIDEFQKILKKHDMNCVFYAHIATGELHLRPLINLKQEEGKKQFVAIAEEIAHLVKRYRGSLSGEHGDGRLRGSFIPMMFGDRIYNLFKELKSTWDPKNIFNPNKIVDVPPMTEGLRYHSKANFGEMDTVMDYSATKGFIRAVERCDGAGDCRKSVLIGGTMCPTFMVTRDEDKSTRSRANILREFLHNSDQKDRLDHQEIYEVLDLCLSCKGCAKECPSNVDIAKFKAEFLQHYYDAHGVPLRSQMIASLPALSPMISAFRGVANPIMNLGFVKNLIGFAPGRSMPKFQKPLTSRVPKSAIKSKRKVFFFADEFTNFQDPEIGLKAIRLLQSLGYEVTIPKHTESGRAMLSKGLLRKAKVKADENIMLLKSLVTADTPLIGLEPSTILSFRDEYPRLVSEHLREDAKTLSKHALLFEEFFMAEVEKGHISADQFIETAATIQLHGHCQQKSVASTSDTMRMLSLPSNFQVSELKTGCCGMAGSFGYEKEHFELSNQIGEMVLFPSVRNADEGVITAAPGTSCRHHIKDNTGAIAQHPVEIMFNALKIN